MDICEVIARRSTCSRGNIGALVWDPKRNDTVSIGYNGSRPGEPHCLDAGCLMVEGESGCQRTDHAEANAIERAMNKRGHSLQGLHLYCTSSPCERCAQRIRDAKLARLFYRHPYRDMSGIQRLLDFTPISIYRVMPSGVLISERTKNIVDPRDII